MFSQPNPWPTANNFPPAQGIPDWNALFNQWLTMCFHQWVNACIAQQNATGQYGFQPGFVPGYFNQAAAQGQPFATPTNPFFTNTNGLFGTTYFNPAWTNQPNQPNQTNIPTFNGSNATHMPTGTPTTVPTTYPVYPNTPNTFNATPNIPMQMSNPFDDQISQKRNLARNGI
jgi:hypothetical protein